LLAKDFKDVVHLVLVGDKAEDTVVFVLFIEAHQLEACPGDQRSWESGGDTFLQGLPLRLKKKLFSIFLITF
jgi:hypothetical protein